MIIKKSSFCWLLDNKTGHVSNDRLRRFINSDKSKNVNTLNAKNKNVMNKKITRKNNVKTKSKIKKISNSSILYLSDESAEDELFNEKFVEISASIPAISEVEYYDPVWSDIKQGTFLLVRFDGGRKQTVFKYVCCVCEINQDNGEIIVQGFQKCNALSTQFSIKENDKSPIVYEMICAILPNPEIVGKTRKLVYQFPGCVTVIEK